MLQQEHAVTLSSVDDTTAAGGGQQAMVVVEAWSPTFCMVTLLAWLLTLREAARWVQGLLIVPALAFELLGWW